MPVSFIAPEKEIGTQRGDVVVCIPLYGGHDHFVACLDSVLEHTPVEVRILVCDDASPDPRSREHVEGLALRAPASSDADEHHVLYMRREVNLGFPENVNGAFASAAPADVVVLNSDCVVAAGWLEGLREAAYAEDGTASATALTNHGTILSVPVRGVPRSELPEPWGFEDAAAAVRSCSLRLRPRLLTAVGHCVYLRRSALELVGDFDLAFSPGYGEEVDFSQRCLRQGLHHVAADEVLVFHHGGGSFSPDGRPDPVQAEHEVMLTTRYPYYHDTVRATERDLLGPLPRALAAARRALTGLRVVIDARVGSVPGGGADALELAGALARTGAVSVTLIVPDGHAQSPAGLDGLELVSLPARAPAPPLARSDVVHLLGLPESAQDLRSAAALGDRLIVSHHDLVAYHSPSYFPAFSAWDRHRELTRTVLGAADRVIFTSEHARRDALAEDLLDAERASVVRTGLDRALTPGAVPASAPQGAERVPETADLILLIGSDRSHENRIFALRVLEQLQLRHDWQGTLVFAGVRVHEGSSAADEDVLLAANARLAAAVVDLAEPNDEERAWLLSRASLLIYPPVRGGSESLPFQAAVCGVPCLWPRDSWLAEVVPAGIGITGWDPAASADGALALIRNDHAREDNLSALRTAATKLTWASAAERLLALYSATSSAPPARRPGLAPATVHEPEAPLALVTHPRLGGAVFRLLAVGYRASHRLTRWRER